MSLNSEAKAQIIKKHQSAQNDTGSSEVQIALFTTRINELTEHFKIHKKDHHSRRGLLKLVSKRRKLLDYLLRTNFASYQKVVADLNIRK